MPLMKCPYCAEDIQADAQKCRYCGEWLTQHAPTPTTPPKTTGLRGCIVAALLLFLLLAFVYAVSEQDRLHRRGTDVTQRGGDETDRRMRRSLDNLTEIADRSGSRQLQRRVEDLRYQYREYERETDNSRKLEKLERLRQDLDDLARDVQRM